MQSFFNDDILTNLLHILLLRLALSPHTNILCLLSAYYVPTTLLKYAKEFVENEPEMQ